MASNAPIESVVILGNGATAWSAALALVNNLPMRKVRVTLVDGALTQSIGVESGWYTTRSFLKLMGLNESRVMADAHAGFKLGQEYEFSPDTSFVHPAGSVGAGLGGLRFDQIAVAMREQGDQAPYEAYSVAAAAGRCHKFIHPAKDPSSILFTLGYGLHFEIDAYTKHVATAALALGVEHVSGVVAQVNQQPSTGFIQSLRLIDGQLIGGDLFLDCTDDHADLIEGLFDVRVESWLQYLPCNKQQIFLSENPSALESLTKVRAISGGWHRRIAVRNRIFHDLTFCGEINSEKLLQAEHSIKQSTEIINLRPGFRTEPWCKNCLALGGAMGYAGDLAISPLHLAQSAIARLLDYFPGKDFQPQIIAEYNRITAEEWRHVRDFHCLHYYLHGLKDHRFEDLSSIDNLPENLRYKLEVFKALGRMPMYEEESLTEEMWSAFLLGANYWPDQPSVLAQTVSVDTLHDHCAKIRALVARAVKQLPPHQIYLKEYISSLNV